MWRRLAVSVAIGISSGLLCWAMMRNLGLGACDFNSALREAGELVAGRDPYTIFHGTPSYPLPAAIVGLAFIWVKPEIAAGLFFGTSSALLAFGLARQGYTRLLVFLAYPYWAAMLTVQWAPLIMASALLPWLLPVTTAKPQLGAPVFLTYLTKPGVVGCVLLLLASLLVIPNWPLRWLSGIGQFTHFVPLLALPGPALLLALWRHQDRDSHLFLLSALAPQHWFYDSFILWLIPKTRQEILFTVCLSWGAGITRWYVIPRSWSQVGSWAVWWIYLPMLAVILWRGTEGSRQEQQRLLLLKSQPTPTEPVASTEG
ncbi:MAG TPA: hypothetical protein VKT29_07525 [Terriglobales bacterium]|nr:hypothetical protein [Terriglobales bacterium]